MNTHATQGVGGSIAELPPPPPTDFDAAARVRQGGAPPLAAVRARRLDAARQTGRTRSR